MTIPSYLRIFSLVALVAALLIGCSGEEVEKAKERAKETAQQVKEGIDPYIDQAQEQVDPYIDQAQAQMGPYIEQAKQKWSNGKSLDEAIESGVHNEDGSTSIELCELSNAALTNWVGGAASMGTVLPVIAGESVLIIATASGAFLTVAPAIDPTFTSAAATVAVLYGAMKVYCARDQIFGNQTVTDFVALVNEYADKGKEAIQQAYAEVLQAKDNA